MLKCLTTDAIQLSSSTWRSVNWLITARAARSAVRAERFPERTDAKVATASTNVLPAPASEEIFAQFVIARSLTRLRRCGQHPIFPMTCLAFSHRLHKFRMVSRVGDHDARRRVRRGHDAAMLPGGAARGTGSSGQRTVLLTRGRIPWLAGP